MPKKGQTQPWKVIFQYEGQDLPATRAHGDEDTARVDAEQIARNGCYRGMKVDVVVALHPHGEPRRDVARYSSAGQLDENDEPIISITEVAAPTGQNKPAPTDVAKRPPTATVRVTLAITVDGWAARHGTRSRKAITDAVTAQLVEAAEMMPLLANSDARVEVVR